MKRIILTLTIVTLFSNLFGQQNPINNLTFDHWYNYGSNCPDFNCFDLNWEVPDSLTQDTLNKENLEKLGLNERQVRAIEYLKLKASITNKEYQSLFDITDRTALRDLNDLVTKGLVQKKGAKKGTRYLLHHVG